MDCFLRIFVGLVGRVVVLVAVVVVVASIPYFLRIFIFDPNKRLLPLSHLAV